jgi:hypothetical protein
MLFKTSEEQLDNLKNIIIKMTSEGLESFFIEIVYELASYDQGVYDLCKMWNEESLQETKDKLIHEIKECIKDYVFSEIEL